MNIETYLTNKAARLNTLYRVINGEGFFIYDGRPVTEEEFFKMFPLTVTRIKRNDPNSKGVSIDPGHLWMGD